MPIPTFLCVAPSRMSHSLLHGERGPGQPGFPPMAGEEHDLELGPTLTAEELAAARYEAAVARGEVLDMNCDDEDEPCTQETEQRELPSAGAGTLARAAGPAELTCAICYEATEFADLPCCDATGSTFQCCLECLVKLCARGGGTAQCPRCRAPISIRDYGGDEATWEHLLGELAAEVVREAHREAVRHAIEAHCVAVREELRRGRSPSRFAGVGRFERLERIGAGVVGAVYKVRDRWTNERLALKRIRFEDDEEGVPVAALREISLLQDLAHPNIVPLFDTHVATNQFFLVLELLDCHLRTYLHERGGLGMDCASFTAQILAAVAHCHERQVLHRDLKPENVLVRRHDRTVKIADFGLSRMFSRPQGQHTQEVVTLWYRAPELLLGAQRYDTPVDVWSVGCILAEMATARPLFPGDSEIDQLFKIFRVRGTPNDHVWPGVSRLPNYKLEFPQWHEQLLVKAAPALTLPALDLLGRCLAYEPSSRITAREARAHAFIDPLAADRAADRAAAAEAARAAADARRARAEARVDELNCDPHKFGGFQSAFTSPARQKRARIVTPPSALWGPPRFSEAERAEGRRDPQGRVSPLLQGLTRLYNLHPLAMAEVVDASVALGSVRRSMYDPDELDEEQRERQD